MFLHALGRGIIFGLQSFWRNVWLSLATIFVIFLALVSVNFLIITIIFRLLVYLLSAATLLAALLDQLDARHRLHLSQSFKVKGNKPCQMYVYDPFCAPTACGWTFEKHFVHPQPVVGRLKNILCTHSLWMDV